jgi:hypothetical protein
MHVTSSQTVSVAAYMHGAMFVVLNLTDAWITRQLIAHGGSEANPIVSGYGADFTIKTALALAIVIILITAGKGKLVKVLNAAMFLVVVWTGGWLLTYL